MMDTSQSQSQPPRSRFLEGSMNDRASNAPPPSFLGGPEELAAYERQFDMDFSLEPLKSSTNTGTGTGRPAPKSRASYRSTAGESTTRGRPGSSSSSFLAPLWDGVKERFSLTRTKSGNNIDDGAGYFSGSHGSSVGSVAAKIGSANGHDDDDMRPSRDDILQNYHTLVANGFFGNHAIQSTRHAPPGQMRHSMPAPPQRAPPATPGGHGMHQSMPPPQYPPPATPITDGMQHDQYQQQAHRDASGRSSLMTGPSFAQRPTEEPEEYATALTPAQMFDSQRNRRPPLAISGQRPVSFSSSIRTVSQENTPPPPHPPPPKRPAPSRPTQLQPTPTPEPRQVPKSSVLGFASVPYTSTRQMPEPSRTRPPLSLARFSLDSARRSIDRPSRGTKRPHADIEMGGVHGHSFVAQDGDTAVEENESGARKVLKKLRKSASRISIDLVRPRARDDESSSMPSRSSYVSSSLRRPLSWRVGERNSGTATGTAPAPDNNYNVNNLDQQDTTGNANRNSDWSHNQVPNNASVAGNPFLPTIAASPASTNKDRNKLKKRSIRDRRAERRKSSPHRRRSSSRPRTADSTGGESFATATTTTTTSGPSSPTTAAGADFTSPHAQFVPYPVAPGAHTRSPSHDDDGDGGGGMEGIEYVAPSFHFPGRVRPGPLSVVPDANRGIPSVPSIPAFFKGLLVDENQQQQQHSRTSWGFRSRHR